MDDMCKMMLDIEEEEENFIRPKVLFNCFQFRPLWFRFRKNNGRKGKLLQNQDSQRGLQKSKKRTKVTEPNDDDDLEDDDSHAAIKSKKRKSKISKSDSSKSKKRKKDKYFAGYAVEVHIQTHI